MYLDQDRQNVGPDLGPNRLTFLIVFLKGFCEKLSFEKSQHTINKIYGKLSSLQRVIMEMSVFHARHFAYSNYVFQNISFIQNDPGVLDRSTVSCHLCNVDRGYYGEHSREIVLNTGKWFRRRYFIDISYLELWQPFCSAEQNLFCNCVRGHYTIQYQYFIGIKHTKGFSPKPCKYSKHRYQGNDL